MVSVAPEMIEIAGEEKEVDQVSLFLQKIEEIVVTSKELTKIAKLITKKRKTPARRGGGSGGFQVPVVLAPQLSKFLNVDAATNLPRTEVTKMITKYIKEHELQCEDNRKNFLCDVALAALFDVPEGTQTNWFEMQRFMSKLLSKASKPENADEGSASVSVPAPASSGADVKKERKEGDPKKKLKKMKDGA